MMLRDFVPFRPVRRFFLLLTVALAVNPVAVHGAGATTMAEDLFPQLGEVLKTALAQSPRMLERNLQRLEAEQLVLVSSAPLYPRVSASARYDYASEDRSSADPGVGWDPTNRYTLFFTANHPLYHWGALAAGADIGRLQAKMASHQAREAYRELARSIRSSYLQLIIEQSAMRQARRREEGLRRQFTVLEARIASGELQPGATGLLQIALNETNLAVNRAEVTFERALRVFRRLCGQPDFSAEQLPGEIPDVPRAALDPASIGGTMNDGRLQSLAMGVEVQRLQLAIARVAQRPKLDLLGGYSYDQLTYVSDFGERTGVQSLYVGLSVGWNIFDGRATRGRILAARTRLEVLENQLADLKEELHYAAGQSATEVEFAARALKNTEDRYGAAVGGFNLTRDNFAVRRASQDDLDNAQLGLNDAEINLFRARADYLNALAAWHYSLDADPAVVSAFPSTSAP